MFISFSGSIRSCICSCTMSCSCVLDVSSTFCILSSEFERVSRSRTMHPQSPSLTIGGTVLKESDDLVILGVTFDSKMTFEKHLRSVSRAASQRLGILRKSWRVFHDRSLPLRYFQGFVLPVLYLVGYKFCVYLQYGAQLPIHTLNYWTVQSVVPGF